MGYGFVAIGAIMFLAWFVQYGLCCRAPKKNKKKGKKASSKFSDEDDTRK